MAQNERPVEHEAVRTTIVGGRPPGSGKPVGPIPRGIEVLIKKAAVDAEFRRVLLEKRADAAREIGLKLDPAETLILKAATAAQLETIIARTTVAASILPAFLGRAAAVMLVALGASTIGCTEQPPPSAGDLPDRPPAKQPADTAQPAADTPKPDTPPPTTKGIRPDVPEPKPAPAPVAPNAMDPTGIRPDRPDVKPAPAPETPAATDTTPAPSPQSARPTGIRPDRPDVKPDPAPAQPDAATPPTATGVRPDRPQSRAAEPGHTLILADANQPAPPPPPMPPTGIRPDRPATAVDAQPTFTGISPDRPANPPAPTGVRPDKPATPDGTKQGDLQKQVAVTALKIPEDWNEQKFADVLATHLKALAEKSLPDAKVTVQNDDKGRRVRIEWKTQRYEPQPPPPPVAVLGARPATLETGPAADGLILDAWLEPELDLVNRPKVLDNSGRWETRQDQVFVLPLKKCLKFDASWGPKTDRQIVATFSTAQRWFEGESISTQTYVPPGAATTPNPATSRGARPDRPAPKPQEGPMMPMAGVPAYRPSPEDAQPKPAPEAQPPADAPAPAPPPAPGRMAGVQADRPADGSQ